MKGRQFSLRLLFVADAAAGIGAAFRGAESSWEEIHLADQKH